MDPEELFAELQKLAAKLQITVRLENTGGRWGRCRLLGQWLVFIDKSLPLRDKIEALAQALADMDYEEIYMPEFVRLLLESRRTAPPRPQNPIPPLTHPSPKDEGAPKP